MSRKPKYTESEREISKLYSSLKQRNKKIDGIWGRENFIKWYKSQIKECYICGISDVQSNEFRKFNGSKRRRGFVLEIDRIEPNGDYKPDNCKLICYWCNNAKSDVFSVAEFESIGKAIGQQIKKRLTNH